MSDNRLITCEQLDERLSDWLERDLDAGTRAALERHMSDCARCTALVADVESIRREAAALPALTPSRDLWPEIEARIQAPVITLNRSALPAARSADLRSHRWWMAVAAAGLVAVTAGVTYFATVSTTPQPTIAKASPASVRTSDTMPIEPGTAPPVALASDAEPSDAQPNAQRAGALRAGRPSGSSQQPDVTEASEYSRDIAQLRAIVAQRRTELDSTTVAVLERNLELIDRAIAESRAALKADPASEFLADQLARAMTKKVAILRTVALLPARS